MQSSRECRYPGRSVYRTVAVVAPRVVAALAVLLTLVLRPAGFFGKRPAF